MWLALRGTCAGGGGYQVKIKLLLSSTLISAVAFASFGTRPLTLADAKVQNQAQEPNRVDSCEKSCLINADCGIGANCVAEICQYQKVFCLNDRWSLNERGEYQDCDAYACDPTAGLCRRTATDYAHCTPGYVMNEHHQCVSSINCDPHDVQCQELIKKWKESRAIWESYFPTPRLPVYSCIACKNNSGCDGQHMCWNGRCVKAGTYCGTTTDSHGETWHGSFNSGGLAKNCGDYACAPVSGDCYGDCLRTSDCRQGLSCVDGRCVNH